MHKLCIGLDLGTSACRACVIDTEGRIMTHQGAPLPALRQSGLRVEQDPQIWWQTVLQVLCAISDRLPNSDIAAVAVDGTSGTLVACDDCGQPLHAALMYHDGRAREEAKRIAARTPAMSGAHGATSSLAKAVWLKTHHPEIKPAHYLHQAEWIANRLTGRFGLGDENNCLKLGYDPIARCWPTWLHGLGIEVDALPGVTPPGTSLGSVTPSIAAQLGLPASCQVIAGTTDSVAGFLATGASKIGDAVSSLGSTLALKILGEAPVFAPQYGVYSHRLGNRWLVGGASNSGGAVLQKFFSQSELDAMTPLLRPDRPTGLDYYPLLAPGERFPIADPDWQPRLTPRPPEPVQFFQAILEGIAGIEALGYRRLHALGAPYPASVRTVGGGARNAAWTAMRRLRLGVDVLTPEHSQAAYGAAILARDGIMARRR